MADQPDMKFCTNCKREIAAANFIMHEVHCRRNIVLCERCEEPVPRSELQAHFDETHASEACEMCEAPIEKCEMEDHVDVCPKRPQQCAYCELEMPFSELAGHQDYCGSRTEQCPLCSQYIMCKDLTRHEDSNCSYPVPKPRLNNMPASNGIPQNSHLYDIDYTPPTEYYNNFAMDELSRMLHTELPGRTTMPSLVNERLQGQANRRTGANNIRSMAASRNNAPISRSLASRTNTMPSRTNTTTSRTNTTASRTNTTTSRNNTTTSRNNTTTSRTNNIPSRTNAVRAQQNARNARSRDIPANQPFMQPEFYWPTQGPTDDELDHSLADQAATHPAVSSATQGPTESDLDHLLAMHLATDLSDEQDWSFLDRVQPVDPVNLNQPEPEQAPEHHQLQENSDDFYLPCEFCGEAFPSLLLLDHQDMCTGPTISDSFAPGAPPLSSPGTSHMEFNNSPTAYSSGPTAEPNVLDNLGYLEAQNRLYAPVEFDSVADEEEVFLPCEFCDQPFPQDFIIQHQSLGRKVEVTR